MAFEGLKAGLIAHAPEGVARDWLGSGVEPARNLEHWSLEPQVLADHVKKMPAAQACDFIPRLATNVPALMAVVREDKRFTVNEAVARWAEYLPVTTLALINSRIPNNRKAFRGRLFYLVEDHHDLEAMDEIFGDLLVERGWHIGMNSAVSRTIAKRGARFAFDLMVNKFRFTRRKAMREISEALNGLPAEQAVELLSPVLDAPNLEFNDLHLPDFKLTQEDLPEDELWEFVYKLDRFPMPEDAKGDALLPVFDVLEHLLRRADHVPADPPQWVLSLAAHGGVLTQAFALDTLRPWSQRHPFNAQQCRNLYDQSMTHKPRGLVEVTVQPDVVQEFAPGGLLSDLKWTVLEVLWLRTSIWRTGSWLNSLLPTGMLGIRITITRTTCL